MKPCEQQHLTRKFLLITFSFQLNIFGHAIGNQPQLNKSLDKLRGKQPILGSK